jgi:hypothetical protein
VFRIVCSHNREFQQKFPGVDIPARSTICYLDNKFKTMGLVLDKKIKRRHHLLSEVKLDDIGLRLVCSPRKSLAKLAQHADVSSLLSKNCYKITEASPV